MRQITKLENTIKAPVKRKRVAAYARVSSGKEAQIHSLSSQVSYYNRYIGSRGDWELVGIYADEALTGTKENRPEFQRLLTDCRLGKIDMVITKSITRLARNTVTLLETVRELKSLEIDVYFEKENIHTLSADGELMLTLLASYAQEESRSASENTKWRIQKMFEQGIPSPRKMLGYRLKNGVMQVVPEEAEVVKMIFSDFLSGMGKNLIVKKLEALKIPTLNGGHWRENTIYGILTNEHYTGDLLLQKTYRLDHISKKNVRNQGERPMYFVKDNHEAIIDRDTFARAQAELKRRSEKYYQTPKPRVTYPFTGLVRCKMCGKNFRRKIAISGNHKYSKPVWSCSTYNIWGKQFCPAQQIPEAILAAKTSEVLKTSDWDRETLLKYLLEIQVPEHNHLVYVFRDGHTEEVFWQNISRKESWTKEMKQKAREKQLAEIERRKHGDAS